MTGDEDRAAEPGSEGRRQLLWPAPFSWPEVRPLATCVARRRACCRGVVRSTAAAREPTMRFEGILADESGQITLVFLGRDGVPGIVPGVALQVEGMVGSGTGTLVMLNPRYRFVLC